MHLSYKYETQGMAGLQYWDATIDYTWGPPTASVTVLEIKNIWGFSEKRSIAEVPRAEADDDPLYTPPRSLGWPHLRRYRSRLGRGWINGGGRDGQGAGAGPGAPTVVTEQERPPGRPTLPLSRCHRRTRMPEQPQHRLRRVAGSAALPEASTRTWPDGSATSRIDPLQTPANPPTNDRSWPEAAGLFSSAKAQKRTSA
jgi:hypothetical protein